MYQHYIMIVFLIYLQQAMRIVNAILRLVLILKHIIK